MKTLTHKPRRFASYADIPKTYRELCRLYLPRPIHDDAEDAEATAIMNALAVFPRLNAEQRDYFDVLTEFVDEFDKSKNVKASVVHVEGDPDHPISRGTLCPKGAALRNDITHTNRLTTPKVRRPGSDHWEDISWDEAIAKIARHVKDTRDRTFVAKNAKDQVVNRTPGIAWIGGCTDTNEFNFLMLKTVAALGIPYRDTQARV